MRIVLLGAPGSGKGTQGEKIVAKYGVTHISTGEVLRAEVEAGSNLGRQAKAIMDAGELVSDEIILAIAKTRIMAADAGRGFMLDGFPRTLAQAEGLDAILAELGQPLHAVVLLEVDNDEVLSRLLARKRADDNEETIRKRLEVYQAQTAPLVDYYRAQGKLRPVPGVGDPDQIFARVSGILDPAA
jgi:adenylate kinase